jgi:tetratricopeptide (TPR) repeat protein
MRAIKRSLALSVMFVTALSAQSSSPQFNALIAEWRKHMASPLPEHMNPRVPVLREEIVTMAGVLREYPQLPDDAAQKNASAGVWAVQARTKADTLRAISEFEQVLRLAPWWRDAYFNLASMLERVGRFEDAIVALELYVKSGPEADELQVARSSIARLLAKQEVSRSFSTDGRWVAADAQWNALESRGYQRFAPDAAGALIGKREMYSVSAHGSAVGGSRIMYCTLVRDGYGLECGSERFIRQNRSVP